MVHDFLAAPKLARLEQRLNLRIEVGRIGPYEPIAFDGRRELYFAISFSLMPVVTREVSLLQRKCCEIVYSTQKRKSSIECYEAC
jgi:hypothetical protein